MPVSRPLKPPSRQWVTSCQDLGEKSHYRRPRSLPPRILCHFFKYSQFLQQLMSLAKKTMSLWYTLLRELERAHSMLFSLRWIVGDRTYSTDQAFAEQDASIIELPHNLTSSTSASDSLPWTAKGRTKYMDLEVGSITSYVIVSWEGGRKENTSTRPEVHSLLSCRQTLFPQRHGWPLIASPASILSAGAV